MESDTSIESDTSTESDISKEPEIISKKSEFDVPKVFGNESQVLGSGLSRSVCCL